MRKFLYKLLFIVLLWQNCLSLKGQPVTFQKNIANAASSDIQQTNDKGYIIVGTTSNFGSGGKDILLVKTDSTGAVLWAKSFGGADDEFGKSVKQISDKGYIIAGYTSAGIYGTDNNDILLIKTDSTGNQIWVKKIGGTKVDYAYSLELDTDGGYIIAGETYSFGNFGGTANIQDVFLIKINNNGNLLWTKVIGSQSGERCNSVKKTNDGGFILAGQMFDFSEGNWDVYLVKTDGLGNILWSNTYGGTELEYAVSCQQTGDGDYIITGHTRSFGDLDVYLLKTDGMGNLLWSKSLNVVGNSSGGLAIAGSDSWPSAVQQSKDKGYIITGHRDTLGGGGQDIFLIKTDSMGNLQYSKIYNEGQTTSGKRSTSGVLTKDDGFIITGTIGTSSSIIFIKTDSTGSSGCLEYDVLTNVSAPPTVKTAVTSLSISGGTVNDTILTTTSGNGTFYDVCATVNVKEDLYLNRTEVMVFPNPFTDRTTFTFAYEQKNTVLKMVDVLGKELKNIVFDGKELTIERSEMKSGIYLYQVFINDIMVNSGKVVIAD
ncbi:MAG: T9SS type A sorting domain-containing protein [Bacteroidota bacterium]